MSATPDGTANFSGDSGDEYEETVRQQRAENAALLASLDLQSGGSAVLDPQGARDRKADAEAQERRKKRLSTQRAQAAEARKKRRKVEQAEPAPARSSARLKGRTPAGMEEENKRIEEETRALEETRREAQKLLHQKHDLGALLGPDDEKASDGSDEEDGTKDAPRPLTNAQRAARLQDTWADVLSDLAAPDADDVKYAGGTKDDEEFAALEDTFKDMQLLSANKVTPKRIYTAAFHPSTRRDVVFTGDKNGYISVWEPLANRDEGNEITGSDGITYNLRIPHDSSPISCIKIPPTQPNKLFSSSYNSTLRRIDLEKGVSEEVFAFGGEEDGDYDDGALLSVFDFQRDVNLAGADSADDAINSNVLWCGDHRGGVIRLDLREPSGGGGGGSARTKRGSSTTRNWQRWQVCEKKIGGLSLNPTNPHALSVASLDQSIHIFDVRRLQTLPPTTTIPNNYKNVSQEVLEQVQGDVWSTKDGAQMGYNSSKQASTSVDWSPDGRKLASVSYEDVVRVWDLPSDWLQVDAGATASTKKTSNTTTPKKANGLMRYIKRERESSASPITTTTTRPTEILSHPQIIPHNNQTGKWLTLFRVRFSPLLSQPNHFTIGSMRRECEIWHTGSTKTRVVKKLFDPEWTSAVQAVSTFHPKRPARVVTGNASGRCLLWGVQEE